MSRPNSGGLWIKEAESDRHPNMQGTINIEGKEYWLSGWATRNPEGNRPNISLKVKPKEPRKSDPDDGIPF